MSFSPGTKKSRRVPSGLVWLCAWTCVAICGVLQEPLWPTAPNHPA